MEQQGVAASPKKFSLAEREVKIRQILCGAGKENEVVTPEDVKRIWAEHIKELLPETPFLALWTRHSQVLDVVHV